MLRHYQFCDGRIQNGEPKNSEILVYLNPDEHEKKYLTAELTLDEHTLNSSLDPDELSRLEFEPEHTALIIKRPKMYSSEDQYLFRVSSMGIFLFNNRLIVVAREDFPMFDDKKFTRVTSIQDIMLKLLYRSVSHFYEHLKIINQISDELEEKINSSMENKYLIYMFTLEKSLVYYLNAINANSIVLQKLRNNAAKFAFKDEEQEFLDDLMIENTQCYRQAEIYSNILSSLMDARASIVSNNLNILMKRLNIITIAIMVPTFVVSAFSMNVPIPFQKFGYSFWLVMCLAVISVFGFLMVWRYKNR